MCVKSHNVTSQSDGTWRRSRLRRAWRVVAAAWAAVAILAFPFAKPADAKIGTVAGAGIFFTQDSNWTVNLTQVTTATNNSAYHAIDTVYGTTDLDPNTTSGGCTTGHDLCVFDWDYGLSNWLGIAECPGPYYGTNPMMTCGHHQVKINLYVNDYAGYPAGVATARRTLCHEIGHAVGLWHVNSRFTCMQQWSDGSGDLDDYATTISSTERSELNGHYK
jgi:hypothetical protein